MSAIAEQYVIEGWRGVMVEVGLGEPSTRGATGALAAGAAAYAASFPRSAFDEDGALVRPGHFLLTPLAVGAACYLFT